MTKNSKITAEPWVDPDDPPVWTEDHFRRAALYVGGKLIRPADGTWTKPGRPLSENPKKQVTLRLDPDVVEKFRATGKGWQSRINAELRKALGI
ncbi:BrnA antitoxin family protein [Novosphingobium sp.]|uniref:BrnA antitoxin family protein n=1 Tax=Novosphingobium sp. TaxID=1874826 RepID=UPI00286B9288|nr:BrnA antitoxin family protein [Novosphingobium sp.]